jgi:signal transduction histidine kinase
MMLEPFGLSHWFGQGRWNPGLSVAADLAVLTAGLVVVLRRPERAAAGALVGLIFLGTYGILLAGFWPSVPGGFFGVLLVTSRQSAIIGGGVQGVALLIAAARLAPRIYRTPSDEELAARAEQLSERVETLTQTRTDAVDTAAAELRRIERDLHDGAQARLVALGMSLQAAERLFATHPESALALVSEAKEASSRALTELRDLVRGIYPPVLADRGLADAVKAFALDTPLHTVVQIDLPGEVDMPVGSAVYFAVAEALANAAKHSGAHTVRIQLSHHNGILRAEITDDGAGGADPDAGTGLKGIERRLATFDGILAVSSPPGGPTIIVVEVPCALSSPKTSSC